MFSSWNTFRWPITCLSASHTENLLPPPFTLLFLSSDMSVIGAWSHQDTSVSRLCWPWQWVEAAYVWLCNSFAYQLSDVTLVQHGESEPICPLLGRSSGYAHNDRHACLLVSCFKTANAFSLLSGTVQLGDRSDPRAPMIPFSLHRILGQWICQTGGMCLYHTCCHPRWTDTIMHTPVLM